jgi:uncharacterized membrane protein YjjP (DUF1212 family)
MIVLLEIVAAVIFVAMLGGAILVFLIAFIIGFIRETFDK